MFIIGGFLWLGAVAAIVWWKVHVPFNLPRNLPKIPIYVSLIGLWSNKGQDEIYDRWFRKPLEEHGAVRFWFAGQWSILVTKPEYLGDLFRNEDIYAKAGNQKKIPGSVMATLLGDNVISSHGHNWRLYNSIMKPGITRRVFDCQPLVNTSRKLAHLLLDAQSHQPAAQGVLVNPFILRYAISVMGQSFLDIDFKCLDDPKMPILNLQTTIKQSIFKPLFLNFPILDKYPMVFRSRRRAFALVRNFEVLLCGLIRDRPGLRSNERDDAGGDLLIRMLEEARNEGRITEQQFRDNLKITFIVAHENIQLLLNSMFYQIGIRQDIQDRLRTEVESTYVIDPTAEIVNKLPYLTAVVLELLRLYPPISQLTNRISTVETLLGNTIPVPPRTYIGWNAYGVHTSSSNWGPHARDFVPERWGSNTEETQLKFRRETLKGTYIPFNAHIRKCPGQGFVLLQMKIAVFELVRMLRWKVDPSYKFKLPGGGVLAPVGCKIVFEAINDGLEKADSVSNLIAVQDLEV